MAFVTNNLRKLSPNLLKSAPIIYSTSHRMYGSIWQMIGAKWRKFVTGSERVPPPALPHQPDSILEEMYKEDPSSVPYDRRQYAKGSYMQRKSHQMIIDHNKKIRKLEKKINGGRYSQWDYANRW